MTWDSKVKQLLDRHFQIQRRIFEALHPASQQAYGGQEFETPIGIANLNNLYDMQYLYLQAIGYLLSERGKSYIIEQFDNIISNGILSSYGIAACDHEQMLKYLDLGSQDSYYECLDRQRNEFILILAKNVEDKNQNDITVVIIDNKQFDRFHIVGHPELSRLLNESFQFLRDMLIAFHGTEKINFKQFEAARAKQFDGIKEITDYLNMLGKGYILNSISACHGQKRLEYLFTGKQDSFDICSDELSHKIALMLEENGFFMQDPSTGMITSIGLDNPSPIPCDCDT